MGCYCSQVHHIHQLVYTCPTLVNFLLNSKTNAYDTVYDANICCNGFSDRLHVTCVAIHSYSWPDECTTTDLAHNQKYVAVYSISISTKLLHGPTVGLTYGGVDAAACCTLILFNLIHHIILSVILVTLYAFFGVSLFLTFRWATLVVCFSICASAVPRKHETW